jgi:3-dehydroquinate dehydratase II
MKILIINGPNLNLLGKREPEIYGNQTFDDYLAQLKAKYPQFKIDYFQSNIEGEIIDKLHQSGFAGKNDGIDAIVINPGGYSHTSVAIADAISGIEIPVAEVHISNIHSREEFRHQSLTARSCKGVISGFGLFSYDLAIDYFISTYNK